MTDGRVVGDMPRLLPAQKAWFPREKAWFPRKKAGKLAACRTISRTSPNPHCRVWAAAIFFAPHGCGQARGRWNGRRFVDSSRGPIADSTTLIEQTGIPRKVLSRLLSSTKIGVGFRVLDVGCGRGELAAYLDSLGIRCTGMDESPVNVIEARRAVPTCEFNCASIGDPASGPKGGFDLVLVRQASVYQTSLSSPATFSASLQLLARVRPGGCLAFLARIGAGTSTAAGHRFACYARHVGSLPGNDDLHELPDRLIFGRSFRSRAAEQNSSGYAVAVLRLPPQPLSEDEWRRAADVAAHAAGATCCQWAAQGSESTRFRSKVA